MRGLAGGWAGGWVGWWAGGRQVGCGQADGCAGGRAILDSVESTIRVAQRETDKV